jgi:methionyl aminopeptidase
MTIETKQDIEELKTIGKIVADTLKLMMKEAKLDEIGKKHLDSFGARSAPNLTYNFPGTTCISLNEDIAHGLPNETVLKDGDLVNIDVSAELNGYFADTGGSFVVGKSSEIQKKVMKATREALNAAVSVVKAGTPINQIGKQIEKVARKHQLKVIKNLGSHGVGRALHEEPEFIAGFYDPSDRRILQEGQVITIEPFLSTKTEFIKEAKDGWTLFGERGNIAAQYEHTMIITKSGAIVVT